MSDARWPGWPFKSSDERMVPQPSDQQEQQIDTGDHVHNAPSGEDWVVAYVRGDRLCACGWPQTLAALSDCRLIRKATPADRDQLLRDMARNIDDDRGSYARERIAQQEPELCECDLELTMEEIDRGKCAACGNPLIVWVAEDQHG